MNKIYKTLYLKALMLVMITGLFAFSANAQSWVYDQTFNSLYLGERDTVVLDTSAMAFETNVRYYLYRDLDNSFDYTDGDEILDTSTSIGDTTLTFIWDLEGLNNYRYGVAAISGFGTNVQTEITGVTLTGVVGNDPTDIDFNDDIGSGYNFPFADGEYYAFDNTGFRGLETTSIPELDVDNATTAIVSFDFYLVDIPANSDDSVVFEYSTNGTTWVTLIDSLNNAYGTVDVGPNSAFNVSYELPAAAKEASTMFRFRQGPTSADTQRSDYVQGEAAWYIDPESFVVSVGDETIAFQSQIGNYSVIRPFTSISITDTTGNQDYYGGGGFEIDAIFSGFQDQVADFNYVAVFRNSETGQSFSIENTDVTFGETEISPSDFDYDFEIDGVIPTDIDYSDDDTFDDWTVSVEAFTGSTPTVGNSEDLLPDGTVTGGPNNFNFNGDTERFFLSEELDIQTVDGAFIILDINKNLGQLYPDGTEVVLEYTTDGSAFTSLIPLDRTEEAISLNDTIDGFIPFIYDLSTETGLISTTTQFRVRQLSNSGLNLDTWGIDILALSTEGTLLENNSTISYNFTGITINPPVVVLDPVDVPEDFIYPGDQVTLTYNVTLGEFDNGTTFNAVLYGDEVDYVIGSSDLIAPGEDEDHEITITIPPIIGGNYEVNLVTNPESNSIIVPVFNTELSIVEITSDNGITDNGVDIFYPGDNFTVFYDVVGQIGSEAELFLEYFDYDLDEYVTITSTQTFDGSISGTFPTGVNYDDEGGDDPYIQLRIGNGLLATSSLSAIRNENGILLLNRQIRGVPGGSPGGGGNTFSFIFDESTVVGNDPTALDDFIGSGERTATTLPVPMPFGGEFSLSFEDLGEYNDIPQTVTLSASNDEGANFTVLEEYVYDGDDFEFEDVVLPASLWGDAVVFKFSYNADGASAEFENSVDLQFITILENESTSANSVEENIAGQLRSWEVSLEILDDTDFIVGEEITVEYTTEGPFPATTGYALVFEGDLDAGDGAPGGYDDGEDFFTVVATSTDQGSGSFTFNVPDMAYEFDGTDDNFDLYDILTLVAYDATGGADFLPNEVIVIDSDDYFLVIEGTDEEDGNYTFDLPGDRSALTDAFDLSGAASAWLNFNYNSGIDADDNILTIPQLQYSIDAGASFVNIDIEDSELGGGYIVGSMGYAVMVPAEALTSATHFRWVQDLNLGADEDTWNINGISIELVNGNEITSMYNVVNDEQGITVSHPSTNDYELTQVDPDDAIFNGETANLSFDPIFETFDAFPPNTAFEYLLYDISAGGYIIDPETNEPLRIGTASGPGTFTASIPFYVENGSYEVHLIAEKTGSEDQYFYVGSDNDGINIGTIEVFLRVLKTVVDFDDLDVLYAGSTVTVNIDLENDETNLGSIDALNATLCIEDYDGDDDLIIATQTGIAPITVDLPPHVRGGNFTFIVKLSEEPLGEVGDLIGETGDLTNLEDDPDNFINQPQLATEGIIETPTFIGSETPSEDGVIYFTLDYESNGNNLYLEYSFNGGNWVTWANFGTGSRTNQNFGYNFGTISGTTTVQFRWRVDGGIDGGSLMISDASYDGFELDNILSPSNYLNPGALAFENDFGRGLITTREFEAGELSNTSLVSFDLTFPKLAEEITSDQFLIFEYSVDGGSTFTEVASFPDVDEENVTLNDDNFLFNLGDLADDVQSMASIWRFRQEERNNIDVVIDNFSFLPVPALPFDYVSDMQGISPQVVLVTSLGTDAACLEDELSLGVEVRGRLGDDAELQIGYDQVDGTANGMLDAVISGILITEDETNTVTAMLPSDVFTNGESNKHFRFKVNYNDETNEDFMFSSNAEALSENSIEIVAPVDIDASGSITSGLSVCDGDELLFTLSNPQDNFSYEVINLADGSVASGATPFLYDPILGEVDIPLTGITEDTEVQLRVTPGSSLGAVANCSAPITSTATVDLIFSQNLIMFWQDQGVNTSPKPYKLATTGTSTLNICEGGTFSLAVNRDIDDAGSGVGGVTIEWFRDDEDNPIGVSDAVFNNADSYVPVTGSYFARITDGTCVYTTEAVQINVAVQPDQPVITVVSGNLAGCETEADVTLEAPEAPAGMTYFYQWSAPGGYTGSRTSRTIVTDVSGTYTVEVSELPFTISGNCGSVASEPVIIERYESPNEFGIADASGFNGNEIVDGSSYEDCENFTVYFFDVDDTGSGSSLGVGTVEIIRDGARDGFQELTTSGGNTVTLTESGTYSFNWINDDAQDGVGACGATTVTFTLTIVDTPNAVEITSSGALDFCDGEGAVTLTAPAGFARYQWYRNGSPISSDAGGFASDANEIVVTQAGTYTVAVSNLTDASGCFSAQSNGIEVRTRTSPNFFGGFSAVESCGAGPASFELTSTSNLYVYQLIDGSTGLPSGTAMRGGAGTLTLMSDPITDETEFDLQVSYADGEGCPNIINYNRSSAMNNVTLYLDGNDLVAEVSGSYSSSSSTGYPRWYRVTANGNIELRNNRGDETLKLTDAGEYIAEVDFEDGCVISVSSTTVVDAAARIEITAGFDVIASPNPAVNSMKVNITGGFAGPVDVSIVDLSGRVEWSNEFVKTEEDFVQPLDLTSLGIEPGIYNLVIRQAGRVESIRIVKQ